MKYCTKCGTALKDGTKFCPKCGMPVPYTNNETAQKQSSNDQSAAIRSYTNNANPARPMTGSSFAIISRIIALVSALLCFIGCFLPWCSAGITLFGVSTYAQTSGVNTSDGSSVEGITIIILMIAVIALNGYSILRHVYTKKISIPSAIAFIINLIIASTVISQINQEMLFSPEVGLYLILFISIVGIANEIFMAVKLRIYRPQ